MRESSRVVRAQGKEIGDNVFLRSDNVPGTEQGVLCVLPSECSGKPWGLCAVFAFFIDEEDEIEQR